MSAELFRYYVSDNIAEIMLDRAPVNAPAWRWIDALPPAALAKARDDGRARRHHRQRAQGVLCRA